RWKAMKEGGVERRNHRHTGKNAFDRLQHGQRRGVMQRCQTAQGLELLTHVGGNAYGSAKGIPTVHDTMTRSNDARRTEMLEQPAHEDIGGLVVVVDGPDRLGLAPPHAQVRLGSADVLENGPKKGTALGFLPRPFEDLGLERRAARVADQNAVSSIHGHPSLLPERGPTDQSGWGSFARFRRR